MLIRKLSCLIFLIALALSMATPLHAAAISARIPNYFGIQPGDTVAVSILMQSSRPLFGVDFRLHFDKSIFQFVSIEQDTGLRNWEWFYPQHDSASARASAIADLPGPTHPDSGDYYPKGSIARVRLVVSPSWVPDSVFHPFNFYWATCGDNAGSDLTGDTLIVISRLFNFDGSLLWDELDDVHFPEANRPPHIGVSDTCQAVLTKVLFLIDLQNGGASSYFTCGDADANGSIDISDVVYLISYIFSAGPPPAPPAAGDADCSGGVDISDAVALIAYIFGSGPAHCDCR